MISRNLIKYIHSLELKKNRKKENAFVAEGPKIVEELLQHFQPLVILGVPSWIEKQAWENITPCERHTVTHEELERISFLQHPQQVMAVFAMPDTTAPFEIDDNQLYIALDGVQDPGNMGTIIRVADWYGINTLLCSETTADAYNPKVVQATMGSIARVRLIYTPLQPLFDSLPHGYPIYGTLLHGENIYTTPLTKHGIIVMGNEGNGIGEETQRRITRSLTIPRFGTDEGPESLNVAIATAIVCSEFRRGSTGYDAAR
ncbi:MAG: TrmH family RNA methyltransferase [Prevotella sp.]